MYSSATVWPYGRASPRAVSIVTVTDGPTSRMLARLNPAQMLTTSASPDFSSASPRPISSAIGPFWWRPRSSP
jgi:hypothetical protein